ncbi:MAG: cupredoxin domain-containing protein [Alphaproteobacteria bacterium]|nr:cupredoxin domain-containing protein [Alphaproteobacteria bacterium]
MRRLFLAALPAMFLAALPAPAHAEDPTFTLVIRNHLFEPARLEVPANAKFRLVVKNMDPTAEEFESKELKREKVIAGGTEAVILLGPLKPGTYRFVGEYHEATAKGVLVAK